MSDPVLESFLQAVPEVELHVHLVGSAATVRRLAAEVDPMTTAHLDGSAATAEPSP